MFSESEDEKAEPAQPQEESEESKKFKEQFFKPPPESEWIKKFDDVEVEKSDTIDKSEPEMKEVMPEWSERHYGD